MIADCNCPNSCDDTVYMQEKSEGKLSSYLSKIQVTRFGKFYVGPLKETVNTIK